MTSIDGFTGSKPSSSAYTAWEQGQLPANGKSIKRQAAITHKMIIQILNLRAFLASAVDIVETNGQISGTCFFGRREKTQIGEKPRGVSHDRGHSVVGPISKVANEEKENDKTCFSPASRVFHTPLAS